MKCKSCGKEFTPINKKNTNCTQYCSSKRIAQEVKERRIKNNEIARSNYKRIVFKKSEKDNIPIAINLVLNPSQRASLLLKLRKLDVKYDKKPEKVKCVTDKEISFRKIVSAHITLEQAEKVVKYTEELYLKKPYIQNMESIKYYKNIYNLISKHLGI